mmetsp:Transcript_90656/g.157119  ORF Transcript_90656/g.157119 Transcript_90656/m.157119 type:complete len:98 (-) Transcript_90656:504-797(-)
MRSGVHAATPPSALSKQCQGSVVSPAPDASAQKNTTKTTVSSTLGAGIRPKRRPNDGVTGTCTWWVGRLINPPMVGSVIDDEREVDLRGQEGTKERG